MQKENKIPSTVEGRQKRVDMALEDAKYYEINFDCRVGDLGLKEDIKHVFNGVDEENGLIRYISKEIEKDFWDDEYFGLLTEAQLRAVKLYVDALKELTFAQSSLFAIKTSDKDKEKAQTKEYKRRFTK